MIQLFFYLLIYFQILFGFQKSWASVSISKNKNLVLLLGAQKLIPKASNIWVENKKILKIIETDKNFIIQGMKSGSSEIKVGKKAIEVNVLTLDQMRTKDLLAEQIKQTIGLYLEVKQGSVIVQGRLVRWKDWEMIAKACSFIKCQFIMAAQIADDQALEYETKINGFIKNLYLPEQKIDFSTSPRIHINSKSVFAKKLIEALAPFGVEVEQDSSSIELAPQIKVQIIVAEVKKDFLRHYGIKWPNSFQAQILPSLSGITDPAFAQAEFWEHSGNGRILASPNILCRSGKSAEFLAGGEFPIKLINFKTQDVIWKQYGVLLKISPIADYSGRMSISIQTEVSSIDSSRTVDGIPGLFTNRVQSHFDLLEPKTIALSGLIKNEKGNDSDGLPFLQKIPIIGSLFSSKDFRDNKTELVIFVRPEIISENSTASASWKNNFGEN
jgi:pilus assembly protein CpaC